MTASSLWDVDTQVDFVHADGKLASRPREAPCRRCSASSRRRARPGIPHVASADDHELTDTEISESPDFETTYPPHCLRGTRGAAKIAETSQARSGAARADRRAGPRGCAAASSCC